MRNKRLFLAVLAVVLLASGCYDLETEIRLLPDGSGFLTGWVRVDRRDAQLAAALGGRSLNQQIDDTIANLAGAAESVKGIDLVDNSVFEEGDKTVLRYRFLFDSVASLNDFLNSPAAAATPILLANAKMDLKAGGKCGPFHVRLTVSPRPVEGLFVATDPAISRLDDQGYRLFLEKIFSGEFRLRVIPPGDVKASDAPLTDVRGLPLYGKNLYGLFTGGMDARVNSELACNKAEAVKPEIEGVTFGPAPTPTEIANVMDAIPLLLQTSVELTQVAKYKANLTVQIDAQPSMKDAVEFYLPVILGAFPGSAANMTWTAEKTPDGLYRYRFTSREPVNFKDAKNPMVFLGKDNGKQVFRMQVPEFPFVKVRPAGAPARRIMTVKATLLDEIAMTNATERTDKSALWTITDQMLKNKVTLEAISK